MISAYCPECDCITNHSIDLFWDQQWWVCDACGEPWAKVRPGQQVEVMNGIPQLIGNLDTEAEPDYDPFGDGPDPYETWNAPGFETDLFDTH